MNSVSSFDFCFDSFDPTSSSFVGQEKVFNAVGIDILAKAWTGYNACLFAYGQTGSGKTYSIMGYHADKGVIPRICDALFYFIERTKDEKSFGVSASYLEIYNEVIGDLLNPAPLMDDFEPLPPKERIKLEKKLKKLVAEKKIDQAEKIRAKLDPSLAKALVDAKAPRVREDPERGVVVDNLKHFAVSSFSDCEKLLDEGFKNRTVGSTAMNATSSRSHCCFQLEFIQKATKSCSRITLVDLAGSEKTETAKTEGEGLREGININKSLSCLGQCISGLAKIAAAKDKEEKNKTPEQKAAEEEERKAREEVSQKKEKRQAEKNAKKAKKKFVSLTQISTSVFISLRPY